MTRETKIGLLVGLAFLLVVGILLSEHITGATERPAAPLADAGHGVRTGVSAPGMAADEPAKIAPPAGPIPTAGDLAAKPAVTQVTVIAPGPAGSSDASTGTPTQQITVQNGPEGLTATSSGPAAVSTAVSTAGSTGVSTAGPVKIAAPHPVVVVTTTDPFANDPVARAAREHGEAVVPVTDADDRRGPKAVPAVLKTGPTKALATNTTAAREYKAQAGDTLSRLAALVPGGNVRSNRDAVVKLNPSLQKDANRVLAGHAYLLPGDAPVAPVAVVTVEKAAVDGVDKSIKAAKTPARVALGDFGRTYVVKSGDTLSKIASTELGSKSELPALRTLNADVLKGSDVIKVDMKLKLPVKLMASVR